MTAEESAALSWLYRASRPLADLADDLVASELLTALGKTSTGRTVTSSTWDKRRAVLHRTVEFARSSGWIEVNPLTGRRLVARHAGPVAVDPRVVVNPVQARQLLAAVTYVGGRRRRDRERGARLHGLSPEQAASPLARRPYDLRHAALSSWLAAGVPPTEVAERPGNFIKVLLTVYAKCLAGQTDAYNERIGALLGS